MHDTYRDHPGRRNSIPHARVRQIIRDARITVSVSDCPTNIIVNTKATILRHLEEAFGRPDNET